jgi:RecJ-like exonuclease
MKRMQVTCVHCGGIGKSFDYSNIISANNETGVVVFGEKYVVCNYCNGKGYTEYAVFSIEEAETILKHCGLNVDD